MLIGDGRIAMTMHVVEQSLPGIEKTDYSSVVIVCMAALALGLIAVNLLWAGDPTHLINTATASGVAP
jgi:hypothetical protein